MRKALLGLLIVVAVGLVVADRVGVRIAQNRIGQQVAAQYDLPRQPDVTIHGIPFLTQVVGGEYDHITVDIGDWTEQGVTVSDVTVDMRGLNAPLSDVINGDTTNMTADTAAASAISARVSGSPALARMNSSAARTWRGAGAAGVPAICSVPLCSCPVSSISIAVSSSCLRRRSGRAGSGPAAFDPVEGAAQDSTIRTTDCQRACMALPGRMQGANSSGRAGALPISRSYRPSSAAVPRRRWSRSLSALKRFLTGDLAESTAISPGPPLKSCAYVSTSDLPRTCVVTNTTVS